jgi:uncharacterized membrane protein
LQSWKLWAPALDQLATYKSKFELSVLETQQVRTALSQLASDSIDLEEHAHELACAQAVNESVRGSYQAAHLQYSLVGEVCGRCIQAGAQASNRNHGGLSCLHTQTCEVLLLEL